MTARKPQAWNEEQRKQHKLKANNCVFEWLRSAWTARVKTLRVSGAMNASIFGLRDKWEFILALSKWKLSLWKNCRYFIFNFNRNSKRRSSFVCTISFPSKYLNILHFIPSHSLQSQEKKNNFFLAPFWLHFAFQIVAIFSFFFIGLTKQKNPKRKLQNEGRKKIAIKIVAIATSNDNSFIHFIWNEHFSFWIIDL